MGILNIPRSVRPDELSEQEHVDLLERADKFGDLAYCDVEVDRERKIVQVVIDNPLPDGDVIVIQTASEKVAGIMAQAAGKTISSKFKAIQLFDGK